MPVLALGLVVAGRAATPARPRLAALADPQRPVTATDQSRGVASNSPKLVADPSEPRFVALANRIDAPDFGCALQVSDDGGGRWLPVRPLAGLPPGVEKCYAPEIAFDRKGTLFYLFVGLAGRGNEPVGAFLTTSSDRGRTFDAPRQVLGPLNFAVRMAIDRERGRLHLVWLHAASDPPLGGFGPGPNPILAAHSDDGGVTFSEPVPVSDPGRERVVAPVLALGGDGSVQVAYYDLGQDARDYQGLAGPVWDGTWSVVLARSTDGGQRFEPGTVVDDAVQPAERVMLIFTTPPPSLVADHHRVCAAWTDARNGDADALLRCSSDGGRSWGELRRLNDDAMANGRSQYLPVLGLGAGGRIDAAFYDRRSDPENRLNDVSYTFSVDHGATFAPNVRVTSDAFDSRVGQRYLGAAAEGQVEFGSRLGLLPAASRAVVAWTDTLNSEPGTTGQDVFAASVELRRSTGRSRLAPRAGLAVGASLLVVVVVVVVRAGKRRRG